MPDFAIEATIPGIVCGIDEAGRGPWAGPVVAGAVILDRRRLDPALTRGLDDSKKLSATRREALFAALQAGARAGTVHLATAIASVEEIDRLNILEATYLAMGRACAALGPSPDHALVDGTGLPKLRCPATAVTKGDQRSLSIAAASIAAKVTRDAIMAALDADHPGYGFARHAGYGTLVHRQALERLGVTPHHRKSFAPIHNILYGK
ncbi:MAG: ribonuclease HII [Alphaproteobacteria bacterium]|nr:ribonuclease HII [Alphaproteobacteria bacterium]